MKKVTLTVKPVCIRYSNKRIGRIKLHVLQDKVYELINKGKNILLNAPTGSGKTLTLLLATSYGGAVGIYPNNTLLINQRNSIHDIITKYSEIGDCIAYYNIEKEMLLDDCPSKTPDSPLLIYRINDFSGILKNYKHIALLTISGTIIEKREGKVKREIVYTLAEIAYRYKDVYIITLTTPDTFLLLYTGAYRDFETIGKLVHNLLVSISNGKKPREIENDIRKSMTAARSSLAPIIGIRARLLEFPLFIDEFHLYGSFELDALHVILSINKEVSIEKYPIVFSSATPAKDTIEKLQQEFVEVKYRSEDNDCKNGFSVRGETIVEIIGVETESKGLGAYYQVGDHVPNILLIYYKDSLKKHLSKGGKVMVILDRVYQVFQLVDEFLKHDMAPVECHVSMPNPKCQNNSNIIVGSQKLTQGVNIENVTLLATTAVGVEDAIQRFGRGGRRGTETYTLLFVPSQRINVIQKYNSRSLNYNEFINEVLGKLYTDLNARKRDPASKLEKLHEIRQKLIYSVAIVSLARVAGQPELLKYIINKIDRDTTNATTRLVYGDPLTLALLLKYRRTGFKIKYKIIKDNNIYEDDIGVIIRNSRIVRADGELLVVDPWNPPKKVKERDITTIDATYISDYALRGKITRLKYLLQKYNIEILINNVNVKPATDVLLYVYKTPPNEDYALFLVQSGEAILIQFASASTIALFM